MKDLVHSVSIAEFDQLKGNTLTVKYPPFDLNISDEELANNCLPDGAHLREDDWVYLVLPPNRVSGARVDVFTDEPSELEQMEKGTLYGLAYFRNVRDATARRGAVQKTMLILARQPYFSMFEPLLREALTQYMAGTDPQAPRTLYDALNDPDPTLLLPLWGKEFSLAVPRLRRDQFGGASLTQLVKRFREGTLDIWYALMQQHRLLFSGQPAREVGNACIACPLLIAPLTGLTALITPYVSLQDTSPIERSTYICGTTNRLFETKLEWYDTLGSISNGSVVRKTPLGKDSADRQFIRNVVSNLDSGEQWVRAQFMNYTFQFLKALEENRLQGTQKRLLSDFMATRLYKLYAKVKAHMMAASAAPSATKDPLQCLKDFRAGGDVLARTRVLYDLHAALAAADLAVLDQVVDANALADLSRCLTESNHNMRKYAAAAVAAMAISVKGQVAILTSRTLDRVCALLSDPMPNVVAAATECLAKVASLMIGALSLVERGVVPALVKLITGGSDNLNVKEWSAQALLHIVRFLPGTAIEDSGGLLAALATPDPRLQETLQLLLDRLDVSAPALAISPAIVQQVQALQAGDADTRAQATASLLSALEENPVLSQQLLRAGGVVLLLENERLEAPTHPLSRGSWSLLSVVTDAHAGRVDVLRLRVVERAVAALAVPVPVYTYSVARFLELCCQYPATAKAVARASGIRALVDFFLKNNRVGLLPLASVALRALRHLARVGDADTRAELATALPSVAAAVNLDTKDPDALARTAAAGVEDLSALYASDATRSQAQLRTDVALLLLWTERLVEGPAILVDAAFVAGLQWVDNPAYVGAK